MAATTTPDQNTQAPNGAAPQTALVPVAATTESVQAGTISAFSGSAAFETAQRMAKALAASSLVPEGFKGNMANCLIAIEIAARIGCSAFAAMQNLAIVHGRPSWSSTFLIGTVNASGRFTPLRFRWSGKEGTDEWGCRAVAKDLASGEECIGSLITLGLAKAEGWATRNGSKYKTMPEQMLAYRAAAFWTRLYAPELSLGLQTREEVVDTVGYEVPDTIAPGDTKALQNALLNVAPPPPAPTTVDADGVVTESAKPADAPPQGALPDWATAPADPIKAKRGAKPKDPEPPPQDDSDDSLGGRM